jgi:uncharacterized peroxidase-related enzyme
MLAHGAVLRKNGFDANQLAAIARDFHNAGLTPEEVALMSFAQKISNRANQVSQPDLDDLRSYGLSDEEILDVILACTARNASAAEHTACNSHEGCCTGCRRQSCCVDAMPC